jgi:hypothetical protein
VSHKKKGDPVFLNGRSSAYYFYVAAQPGNFNINNSFPLSLFLKFPGCAGHAKSMLKNAHSKIQGPLKFWVRSL